MAALAAAFTPPASWALLGDRVEVWVGENVTHDSNLLRLSKNLESLPPDVPQRGDTIETTSLGASLDELWGQQRVTASYSWSRNRYQVFHDFDYDGHNANAKWQWVASSALKGNLAYLDTAGLASFADIQSADPDYVTTRGAFANASYLATPSYRVDAGVTVAEVRHSSAMRKIDDIDTASTEVGFAYVTPLDNALGTVLRVEKGRSPDDASGLPYGNAYRQYGVGATLAWTFAGHSTLEGRIEMVNREYEEATQRNYSGPIARAVYTWTPTGKLVVVTGLARDVGPTDDIQTSFVLVTGGYIRPRWNLTDKISIRGAVEYNVWDYRGDPLAAQNLKNHVRTFTGSIEWRPYPKVLFQAGFTHEARTSTSPTGDYETDIAFIEGRVGF